MSEARTSQITIAIIELVGGAAFERAIREANALAIQDPGITVIAVRKQAELQSSDRTSTDQTGSILLDTIPVRRAKALAACQTAFIAMVEDTIQIGSDWIAATQKLIQTNASAAAWGPIEISQDLPARYRALGLLEYGRHQRCQQTNQDGSNAQVPIPGACMLYRTADISRLDCVNAHGIVEHELFEQLLQQGLSIQCVPGMTSKYSERDPYGGRLGTRFLHGRLYASTKLKGSGLVQRAAHAAKAFLLPPVFFVRAIRERRSFSAKANPLPEFYWVFLLSSAWALGEFTGAVSGAGDSAAGWT